MEPFTALSFAAAAVKFVNFASSLLRGSRGPVARSKPLRFTVFDKATEDVLRHIDLLEASLLDVKEDQTLSRIALDCIMIAQQLVHGVRWLSLSQYEQQAMNPRAGIVTQNRVAPARSKWSTIRQGLQTVWTADQGHTIDSRLLSIPEQLVTSVLTQLGLCVSTQSNSGNLPQLEGLLAFTYQDIPTIIITIKGGETQAVTPGTQSHANWHSRFSKQSMEINRAASEQGYTMSLVSFDGESVCKAILDCLAFRQIRDRLNDIQEAHRSTFDWIFDRRCAATKEPEESWTDFPTWLESELDLGNSQSLYWINGKAGSGKSTLMKCIQEHERTWSHLSKWAPGDKLVFSSFFASALGSRLQRTHQGLLRSLLHDTMKERPDLVPLVMPELFKRAAATSDSMGKSRSGLTLREPSLSELKTWFSRLTKQASENCRLFFQIDGIDEYEGDVVQILVTIAKATSTSKHVKFLMSSRPIPLCVEKFGSVPGLQLHFLTRNDMIKYCDARLGRKLSRQHRNHQDRAKFIEDLVNKSSGVFLWIVLAVRLIQNHGRGDSDYCLNTIRAYLNQMPTELTDLYSHIVQHAVPIALRPEASMIFQSIHTSCPVESEIRGHPGILAIQAAFVLGLETPEMVSPQGISSSGEKRILRQVEEILLTRCFGLLKVQESAPTPSTRNGTSEKRVKSMAERVLSVGSNTARQHIRYIHRTVEEFMQDKNVVAEMSSWNLSSQTGENDANGHYKTLFKSCIAMAKRCRTSEVVHPRGSIVWESMYTGMRYAQLAERSGHPVSVEDLDAFDQIFSRHWNKAQVYYQNAANYEAVQRKHWSSLFFRLSDGETPDGGPTWAHNVRSNRDNGFRWLDSCSKIDYEMVQRAGNLGFLRLAVVYGLGSYVYEKLTVPDDTSRRIADSLQFWRGLLVSSFPLRLKVPAGMSLPSFVLRVGIQAGTGNDVNLLGADGAFTLWNIFLIELCSARDLGKMSDEEARALANLATEFVQLPAVLEAMASGSGLFGALLCQLRAILKSKERDMSGVGGPGLFEMLQDAVSPVEAKYTTTKNDGVSDNLLQRNAMLANRPIGGGSMLKRQFSPSPTPSCSSLSESATHNGCGNTASSGSSNSSLVKWRFGSVRERAKSWSISIHVAKEGGLAGISGRRVLHMIRQETRKMKLPIAKKRAIWREWEVAGVQPITCVRG